MFYNDGLNEGQVRDEVNIHHTLSYYGGHTYPRWEEFWPIKVTVNDEESVLEADLILAFNGNQVSPEKIREWKSKTKAPVWFWTFDNCDRRPAIYNIIKECDLWLGEELGRRERFKKEGLPFYYFPLHAGDEKVFRPFDPPIDHTKPYDVTFMGTPYGAEMRKELLLAVQEKFDLHVWGTNPESWKNWGIKDVHGPAFDQAANEIINQSKIILGVSNCSCEGYWSVRTACVMLAGGFHIVRFTPQMEKECGDGVIYFSDIEDCLKKIEYYLDKDSPCSWQRRIHIQGRANNIAYNKLTFQIRCHELMVLFQHRNRLMQMI